MFGAFRASTPSLGGLLWKNPWRMSSARKQRVKMRLKAVDEVISTLQQSQIRCSALDRALLLPKESDMLPKDKFTTFSRNDPKFRKSVHKVPKFTRKTIRINPVGY